MKPGDLVGVNKDSYLILEKLPAEYDSRVKAMEVDSRYNILTAFCISNPSCISEPIFLCRIVLLNIFLKTNQFQKPRDYWLVCEYLAQ